MPSGKSKEESVVVVVENLFFGGATCLSRTIFGRCADHSSVAVSGSKGSKIGVLITENSTLMLPRQWLEFGRRSLK